MTGELAVERGFPPARVSRGRGRSRGFPQLGRGHVRHMDPGADQRPERPGAGGPSDENGIETGIRHWQAGDPDGLLIVAGDVDSDLRPGPVSLTPDGAVEGLVACPDEADTRPALAAGSPGPVASASTATGPDRSGHDLGGGGGSPATGQLGSRYTRTGPARRHSTGMGEAKGEQGATRAPGAVCRSWRARLPDRRIRARRADGNAP